MRSIAISQASLVSLITPNNSNNSIESSVSNNFNNYNIPKHPISSNNPNNPNNHTSITHTHTHTHTQTGLQYFGILRLHLPHHTTAPSLLLPSLLFSYFHPCCCFYYFKVEHCNIATPSSVHRSHPVCARVDTEVKADGWEQREGESACVCARACLLSVYCVFSVRA